MSKKLLYILVVCLIPLISVQITINTLVTGYTTCGYAILWIVLPVTLLFLGGVWIVATRIVPLTLYRGRYLWFCMLTFAISYLLMVAILGVETVGSLWAGVEPRAGDWTSPVIYIERFCDSTIMTMVLLGTAAYAVYEEWVRGSLREKKLAETLRKYVSTVRTRLDNDSIRHGLDDIEEAIMDEEANTSDAIDNLSFYLRRQLYELPSPPRIDERVAKESAGMVDFLIEKRWRKWRHIAFQILLLIMATEFFFPTPAKLEITGEIICFAVVWYIFLNLLVAVNRFWLYRRYRRHKSPMRYLTEAALTMFVPFLLFLILSIVLNEHSLAEVYDPWLIILLSTFGSLVSMTLLEIGIAVIFLMKYRAQGKMRMEALAAETTRQEYLFLRKQINPHFLFNVLNNINILSYDSREEALQMLAELRRLIEYQFAELSSPFTTIGREYTFLDSYLRLEASRTDSLEFSLKWENIPDATPIPTLLFIPVVENAVKHSKGVEGRRYVSLSMSAADGEILFKCDNNFPLVSKAGDSARPGGLGLTNLRRRLQLLYGEAAHFAAMREKEKFTVIIRIPMETAEICSK